MVRCLSSSRNGTEWYPFHASVTVFFVPWGICSASLNGVEVWWVCLTDCLLSCCRSTVRLGVPSAFAVTTILEHHVTGVFGSTFSKTPRATSLSKSALTLSCQWSGTTAGLWATYGFTSSLMNSFRGSQSIIGSGWCSQTLKVVAA